MCGQRWWHIAICIMPRRIETNNDIFLLSEAISIDANSIFWAYTYNILSNVLQNIAAAADSSSLFVAYSCRLPDVRPSMVTVDLKIGS